MASIFTKLFRAGGRISRLFVSRAELARRAVFQSEKREQEAREAERLDRLRNPSDYRGK